MRKRTIAARSITTALALSLLCTTPAANAAQLSVDQWGRPTPQAQQEISNLINQPWVPQEIRDIALQALSFVSGEGGEPGAAIPEDAPTIAQFIWPTRAENCINGNSAAIGSAFAVPGPADLPLPGVPDNHTAFTFTALGTGPLSNEQQTIMNVQWVNLNTFEYGQTALGNTGINPEGPSTVSGVANTGRGTVIALLSGGLSTHTDGGSAQCIFAPTAAIFEVN